eukprot:scaffold895_cov132-Skeletonema_menzelii.AAC.7
MGQERGAGSGERRAERHAASAVVPVARRRVDVPARPAKFKIAITYVPTYRNIVASFMSEVANSNSQLCTEEYYNIILYQRLRWTSAV